MWIIFQNSISQLKKKSHEPGDGGTHFKSQHSEKERLEGEASRSLCVQIQPGLQSEFPCCGTTVPLTRESSLGELSIETSLLDFPNAQWQVYEGTRIRLPVFETHMLYIWSGE